MKFLKNYSAVLGFITAFVVDYNYGILERFVTDPFWVNIIRGAGALLLAKLTNKNLQTKNDPIIAPPPEIGGGGITNPKPPKP